MKKIKKMILSIFLISSLSSCLGFGEETVQISNIKATPLENGNVLIEIIYSDEDITPLSFIVEKGKEGEQGLPGNGIKEVTTSKNENGSTLTITYSDVTMDPTIIDIKDGTSIKDIISTIDEETNDTLMSVLLSDGTIYGPYVIPKGQDGNDGNSIIGIEQRINRDYSVTLTLHMSQSEDVKVDIPAPIQGEDGRGIENIVSLPSGDTYTMTITYTDGNTQELEFARPNKWFSESGLPSNEEGINGDLWYDLAHNVIYVKQNNRWGKVIDLSQNFEETFTVRFDLNDSNEYPASMPSGSLLTYEIESRTYFASSGYTIPVPSREGYEFIGWYSVKNPSVVNGAFTDMTAVMSDLTLYAIWEEII
ncbi:MAG: InlB B-repeat-containing protein [Erysipelotrichaceae bacterium]|nr:InlB B-repeat-containing protein [Erysipelotrichaceae bacterium]